MGVSRDDQATNDRFAAELELPYQLVGDRSGNITSAYEARWPLIGLARRTTYVIGKDRRVLMAFRSESDVPEHVRRAAAAIGVRADVSG